MSNKVYSVLQAQMAKNAYIISDLESNISLCREAKAYFDEHNFKSDEYEAHNHLKYLRKQLKIMVECQKTVKYLMKEIVANGGTKKFH